uniref:UDP-glucuronosyltransferase n=1 Tax=Knipowitschia caucasica TaxID=637954 RepID=A0AAV2L1X6_KNICA
MTNMKILLIPFSLLLLHLSQSWGGKILVFPVEGSHWINMLKILEVLHARGHHIVVLRMSPSWYIQEKSPYYTCINVPTTSFEESFEVFVAQQLEIRLQTDPKSFWSRMWAHLQMRSLMVEQFSIFHQQCKPPKALPTDLEQFVQSSGEHGVILMSLGTLVSKLPPRITDEIAAAFAQLPQKVIWRYLGPKPKHLGNNTLLVKWFPQNDLLGHPKTRLFVTHGGTNGLQEAIYHGIPIVGMPIFFDQPENLSRIKSKGGAVTVDIAELDRQVLGEALETVLSEASYTENMKRLSRLHRDQPLSPMDLAVFWIEFVIRHKGASHLKSHSHALHWAVYHSLDVIAALLAAALLFTAACVYAGKAVLRRVFRRNKVKNA